MDGINHPKTLLEATRIFADENVAFETVKSLRWPDGVICPMCGGKEHSFLSTRKTWQCKSCSKQFSVKKGTIFEDSPIKLDKWLIAMWLIANAKNGISSYEIHRSLGVTQKTGWFMLQRLRLAMQEGTFEKMGGHVEVDETYIGGKARNMHKDKRAQGRGTGMGTGMVGKSAVMGFLERTGKVRTFHIEFTDRPSMEAMIFANVEKESHLYTDQHGSYRFLNRYYRHETVDHAHEYVQGFCHTNSLENYWSLLKRALRGTYVSVEPFHLFRYLDEQAFRFNERDLNDSERFRLVLSQIGGKRVTYAKLTGKEQPTAVGA